MTRNERRFNWWDFKDNTTCFGFGTKDIKESILQIIEEKNRKTENLKEQPKTKCNELCSVLLDLSACRISISTLGIDILIAWGRRTRYFCKEDSFSFNNSSSLFSSLLSTIISGLEGFFGGLQAFLLNDIWINSQIHWLQ